MKANVINCTRRIDGQYQVIIADTCGGRNKRPVISDRPVKVGTDVIVRDDRVIGGGK